MPSVRVIVALLLALTAIACQAGEQPIRKAVSSGICHDPSSPNYNQIKAYVPYATLADCVASGGRPRKGAVVSSSSTTSAAPPPTPQHHGGTLYDSDDPAIVKKSRGDICYDSSDVRFAGIYHYTAYANVEDCLADGGRLPQ